jgi:hypothetical protein
MSEEMRVDPRPGDANYEAELQDALGVIAAKARERNFCPKGMVSAFNMGVRNLENAWSLPYDPYLPEQIIEALGLHLRVPDGLAILRLELVLNEHDVPKVIVTYVSPQCDKLNPDRIAETLEHYELHRIKVEGSPR